MAVDELEQFILEDRQGDLMLAEKPLRGRFIQDREDDMLQGYIAVPSVSGEPAKSPTVRVRIRR